MIMGIAAKREDRHGLGAVVRAQASLTKQAIAPGAILAVLSGLILTFQLSTDVPGFNVWLIIMQGAGLLAALLTLLISLPTAAKLSRIDPMGEGAGYFDELRQRQRIVASISGTFGLVALFAGAMLT
jgi:hypothetical protein